MRNLILGMLISVCFLTQLSFAKDIYYVQSASTKIYAKRSLASNILGEAGQGQSFADAEKQGNWIKVKFGNKEGFISAFSLRTSPPQQKIGSIISADRQDKPNARSRLSSSQTIVAGVKGLTYEGRTRASKSAGVNLEDLELMESVKIDPAELKNFAPGANR